MLIVTGASGALGQQIVAKLLLRVPANEIGVSVRDPSKLSHLADQGVRVRHGDYEDEDSLRHAWEGAERVLLVSSNAAATGGDTLQQHATAIAVARQLSVDRVLYTSQISSAENSHFPPARHHAATEAMLTASGLAWTAMRHGFYAQSGLAMNARGFASGNLVAPRDGKVSWTTHEDLAEADAALLSGAVTIDGPTPPLTGSEALDLADLAQIATAISGRPIARTTVSDEAFYQTMLDAGVPPQRLAVMLGYFLGARDGEFAAIDPTLAKLIGRQPQTMRAAMRDTLG